jgi:uncharacterized BrkB/YihY/UPF0761 family membrane protein
MKALRLRAFNMGKLALGWDISSQGLESTYGSAASIVVLLIWVYYSRRSFTLAQR